MRNSRHFTWQVSEFETVSWLRVYMWMSQSYIVFRIFTIHLPLFTSCFLVFTRGRHSFDPSPRYGAPLWWPAMQLPHCLWSQAWVGHHHLFISCFLQWTLRPSGKLTVCYRKNGSSRVGKFTYSKWWFSIAVVVYQRVCPDIFVCWYQSIRIFGEDLSIVQWNFQNQWRDCTFKKAMIMWDIPSL